MTAVILGGWLAAPERKVFKAKHGLPILQDYSAEAPDWYWEKFPSAYPDMGRSMVSHTELLSLAKQYGCEDWDRLFKVCQDIKYGAEIGCTGTARSASLSKNSNSSFTFGEQVSDAIADWILKGFASGPYTEDQVPANAKVNCIMCREKPNGAVRIILNLSSPLGLSVNDGIDKTQFPAVMSSTNKWLEVLHLVGKGAWIAKVDWSDAYKHLHVRKKDLCLQWFSWLGRYFRELCLIFGSSSSPGLYDRLAKTVIDLVVRVAGFPRQWLCQHLDDTAAAAPADSDLLHKFDNTYQQIADQIGIKLAPRDDPDKAFGPTKKGTVFGIMYDTVNWTWGLPPEKLARLSEQIKTILKKNEERLDEIQSVVGRIINVKPLVPDGRFHIDHLIELTTASTNPAHLVELNGGFKRQLYFWYLMLRTCNGNASIPDPYTPLPAWSIECFTDAAGGTLDEQGRGTGAVIPALGWWVYMPWSKAVNSGAWLVEGKKVSRKLAALELIGPLITMTAGAKLLRGSPITFWVDNQGSCSIWKHGYSNSCKLSSTIVRALATIAAALGCKIDIRKITRCSNPGSIMADALSKADFYGFKLAGGNQLDLEPAIIPKILLKWCVKPTVDDELGKAILTDLAKYQPILGYSC